MTDTQQTAENTASPASLRILMGAGILMLLSSGGAALDLNDTESLDYYPSNQLEFRIQPDGTIQPRGDIELSGNKLDTSGSTITLRDSTNNQDILRAQEGGDVRIPSGNLDVQNEIRARGGGGADAVIGNKGGTTGFLAFGSTEVFEDNSGNVQIDADELELPSANLDVSGNNITSIDTLKFEEGTSIDGDLTINGSTDIDGQLNLSEDLDLSDNDLLEPDEIRTGGSGSDEISIRDTSNGQDILQAREGGDIQVPNGDIIAGTSGDSNSFRFESGVRFDTPSLSTARISASGGGNNNLFVLRDEEDNLRVFEVGEEGPIDLRNPETGEDILRLNHSGGSDVEIPNGELNVSDRILTNRGSSNTPGYSFYADQNTGIYSRDEDTLSAVTGGNEAFRVLGPQTTSFVDNRVRDITSLSGTTSSPLLLRANQNANDGTEQDLVLQTLDSGNNNYVDALRASANSGSPVINIPNGDLNLNDNNLDDAASIDGGGNAIRVDDSLNLNNNNLDDVASIDGGGDDIQVNDQVQLNNNRLKTTNGNYIEGSTASFSNIDSGSGGEIDIQDTIELNSNIIDDNDGTVNFDAGAALTGNLNLNENEIQNVDGIQDGSGTNTIKFDGNNNVQIPNGVLRTDQITETQTPRRSISLSGQTGSLTTDGTGDDAYRIVDAANNQDNIAKFNEGGEVDISNGNLDLNTNNITSIDTLKFVEGTSIDGDLSIDGAIDTTGDINLSDNDLLDANNVQTNRLVDPEDGQIDIDDNINLQNNQNIRSSGTNAITLDENQNVGIPNGNLNLGQTDLNFGNNADLSPASAGSLRVRSGGGGNNVLFDIRDSGAGDNRFLVREGGNVEVPTGNLDMKGNSVENVNSFSTQQINDIVPFSAQGTGLNNNDNRFVRIGGNQVVGGTTRGLTLVVISKSDYSVKSSQNYDTFGSGTASNNLASKLENMDNSEIGILTSYDAWENSVTTQLDQAFRNVGLYKAAAAPNDGSRRPYAAIFSGTGDSGGSRAQEILLDDSSDQPHAQLRGILIDGSFISKGTKQNNLVANQGNQVGVRALNSGEIEVPNGDIDVRENSIENVNSIQDNAGTDTITTDGNNNVQIPNGNLDVAGGNKGAVGSLEFNNDDNGNIESTGDGALAIDNQGNNGVVVRSDGGSSVIARFSDSGSVVIPNGNLDINGNRLVDGGGNNDDTVFIGDGNNDNVRLETGGEDVDVPDGQVDVNSPANTGRTVDVGGGVNADGDLKTFSGNVASDQRMCIGDRCA